jgi:DNA-binding cell septation regulator SpoVG
MILLFSYFRIFLVLVISLGFCSSLYADLKLTEITKNGGLLDIVLNGDIRISNVLLRNNAVEFPVYKSRNSKVYRQFGILRREFRCYLVGALSESKTSSKTERTVFKINKLSILKRHPTIKAFASVIFNGDIEIECRIMRGAKSLWVAWPSNKRNGIWLKDFEFINQDLRKTVEKELIGAVS